MITTGEQDVPVATPAAAPAVRRGLLALWRARSWWGGLIACGMAAFGQNSLIAQNDPTTATRFYVIAFVVLIAALLHPTWPWRRSSSAAPTLGETPAAAPAVAATNGATPNTRPAANGTTGNGKAANGAAHVATVSAPQAAAAVAAPAVAPRVMPWVPGVPRTNGSAHAVPAAPPAAPVASTPPPIIADPAPMALTAPTGTLPVRRAGGGPVTTSVALPATNSAPSATPALVTNGSIEPVPAARTPTNESDTHHSPLTTHHSSWWARWQATRARWGWRVTAPGLLLTLGLAAVATLLLRNDIGDVRGGWLWAAALAVLVLTFVGAPGWPRGAGLLPGPEGDFFAAGLPRLSPRWEAALVVGMLVLASALRLVNLETQPGVFGDEGERGADAQGILAGQPALLFGYGWWGVPNVYFYLVSFFLRIFGDHNMVADRMLSVISGVAAVWFVYLIGKLLWGPRAGLIAGALLAVSPLALQFSRVAGESTPTGALWAAGFYFLFRALRFRRPLDWVLSGVLCGFSLYFYAAGKLIIPLLGGVGLYCLVRWHIGFFKRYFLGFVLLGLAFGLVFLPYALFEMGPDQWQGFTGRAQETSIFSPQNEPAAFAKYGIPYDPAQAGQSLVQNVLSHPVNWARLVYEQMRVTTEVIYRSGDPTPMYQIQIHGGSMLAPLLAALALLGLAYAAWKFWDGRFGLTSLWFWGGMLGAALTMDTPSVQRLTGAWPVIMLFPAALLDRIIAGAWPLNLSLARRWMTVPLAGLLVFFGADGYQEYFGHYMSLCPYCTGTVQARYAEALGQDYKAYQFGVGGYDIFFTYGPTRFLAKGVEGRDMSVPADFFPVTDNNGKGAAFMVFGSNADYLPLIRLMYPGGAEEVITGTNGSPQFTSYKVSAAQMQQFQALHATYTAAGSAPISRVEQNLGTVRADATTAGPWAPPPGLTYPATATWEGGLVAPGYAIYTFQIQGGGDGQLQVDGHLVLDEHAPAPTPGPTQALPAPQKVDLVLAKGIHDVRLTGTLARAGAPLAVQWGRTGQALYPVGANYLYSGPTGGLSGEIWWDSNVPLDSADISGGKPANYRRSDPFFGFREAHDSQESFHTGTFVSRWTGTLTAPTAGTYGFATHSNGPSVLLIDGKIVVNTQANGNEGQGGGPVDLTAGQHTIELRYGWQGGRATMELYWTPPGGQAALIPPTALTPAPRSWPRGAVPDPGNSAAAVAPPPPPVATVTPDAVLGADAGLKEARGIAVTAQGDIYVADAGNHRVVHLDASGKMVNAWGKEGTGPGDFATPEDIGVGADGLVYVLDSTLNRVQAFKTDGTFQHVLGDKSLTTSAGLTVGPDGAIYVADVTSSRVRQFDPSGKEVKDYTGGSDAAQQLNQPVDVAVGPDGALYVADLRNRVVQLDPATDTIKQAWSLPIGLNRGAANLALAGGLLYVSDPDRNQIAVINLTSGQVTDVGQGGKNPGQFGEPLGVAVGPGGKLYVLDSDNARIQVFSALVVK